MDKDNYHNDDRLIDFFTCIPCLLWISLTLITNTSFNIRFLFIRIVFIFFIFALVSCNRTNRYCFDVFLSFCHLWLSEKCLQGKFRKGIKGCFCNSIRNGLLYIIHSNLIFCHFSRLMIISLFFNFSLFHLK